LLILFLSLCFTANVRGATFSERINQAASQAAAKAPSATEKNYKKGELLVKLREGVPYTSPFAISDALGVKNAKNFRVPKKASGNAAKQLKRWWVLTLPPGVTVETAMARLKKNPNVEVVEPNYMRSIQSLPNDANFSELWGMNNTGQQSGTPDADIDAPEAWDKETGSSDIVVAVIDTGIDYNHEDLAANIWTNSGEIPDNGIDDDGNGYIDDVHGYNFSYRNAAPLDDVGHGTHIAGIIAAEGNNGVGVAGVSWSTKLMPLKTHNIFGSAYMTDIISAMVYAVDMGANVINASYGCQGTTCISVAEQDAISAVNEANILFVAAAGNSSYDNDSFPAYPASYDIPNIVSVAATDRNDNLASFSNYGNVTVDLGAPGAEILSTVPTGFDASGYALADGTSMSTAYVSGAAALLLAHSPALAVEDLKATLLNSVDPVASLDGKTVTGGRLNVNNALGLLPYGAAFIPSVKAVPNDGTGASFTLTLTSHDNFTDTLSLSIDTLATGLSATLSNTAVTLPANGTVSATVNVTAIAAMPRGSYPIRVLMTDSVGHTMKAQATLRILVPGFSVVISPDEQYSDVGSTIYYNVIVDAFDGYAGTVNLSAVSSDRNIKPSLARSVTVPFNGSATTSMTVDITTRAPLDIHTVTVTGDDGNSTSTATALVNLMTMYDLVWSDLSVTTKGTIYTGVPFEIAGTILNQGGDYGPVAMYSYFYLSPDPVLDCVDSSCANGDLVVDGSLLGYYIPGFPAGATQGVVRSVSSYNAGTYYVFSYVKNDYSGTPDELNVANNTKMYGPITVTNDLDLAITSATPSSTTIPVGTNASLTYTLENLGNSSLSLYQSIYTKIYLSTDNVIDPQTDTLIRTDTTSGLAAGASVTQISSLNLTYTPAGTYYIGVITDPDNTYTETNETNNTQVVGPITISFDVDLTMTSATTSASTVYQGDSFTVNDTVSNLGASSTGSYVYMGYYLSTDAVVDTTDLYVGNRSTYNLAGGASNSGTGTVTVPSTLAPGTYYLGVIADYNDNYTESDESNNVMVVGTITVALSEVDLTMTAASTTASTVYPGDSFTVSDTVSNIGASSAGSYVYMGYYLSTDAVVSTADQYVGVRTTYTLAGGASNSGTGTVTVPSTLAPGTYYLGVIADYNDNYTESDESNNVKVVGTITVAPRDVDLTVTAASTAATTLPGGATFSVTDTVANLGTTPTSSFLVRYYLSTDAVFTTSDISVGSRTVTSLAAGGSSSATTTLTATTVAGTYYLGVVADPYNAVAESNETNNVQLVGQVTITSDVDLVMTALSQPPTSVATQDGFTVTDTVTNQGTTGASTFSVAYYISTDTVITTSDQVVGYRYVYGLTAGATVSGSASITLPGWVAPGTYYLGAIADYSDSIAESNETNNAIVVGQFTVTAGDIDLATTDGSVTYPYSGQIKVDTTFANLGTTNFATTTNCSVYFYVSTDAVITTSDTFLLQTQFPTLAAGATSSYSATWSVPSSLAPGTYYVGLFIDTADFCPESDETNNTRILGQITI